MYALMLTVALSVAACVPNLCAPASPYFTDLHECKQNNNVSLLVEAHIDGLYTTEVWFGGTIPLIDDLHWIEVLKGEPKSLHFVVPTYHVQILWRATGNDPWQPASRVLDAMPTDTCLFV